MTVGEAIQRQKEFVANKYHVHKYSNKDLTARILQSQKILNIIEGENKQTEQYLTVLYSRKKVEK